VTVQAVKAILQTWTLPDVHYQADRMPIQIPLVKKEEPAYRVTAEDSSAVADGNPVAAEGSPAAAYIVHIAERQQVW
jgi:hypothetical protein